MMYSVIVYCLVTYTGIDNCFDTINECQDFYGDHVECARCIDTETETDWKEFGKQTYEDRSW